MKRVAAMVLSDRGSLLPFTCQNTVSQCEEEAPSLLCEWEKMKKNGAKIVQVEIRTMDEEDEAAKTIAALQSEVESLRARYE